MEDKLDPTQFSREYLENKGFGVYPLASGKILMLCPREILNQIPMGTPLTSISDKAIVLHESHNERKIDGKPNPFYIDKDFRYYGGSLPMLAYGILVYC